MQNEIIFENVSKIDPVADWFRSWMHCLQSRKIILKTFKENLIVLKRSVQFITSDVPNNVNFDFSAYTSYTNIMKYCLPYRKWLLNMISTHHTFVNIPAL